MLFSIIVPIYHVEAYLPRCIDSILSQTYPDFELILVDDGSPDNCPQLCDAYAEKDPRIHVIHKKRGGLVNTRNTGLCVAKGEYICWVDGDDWVSPDWLSSIHDTLDHASYRPDLVAFDAYNIYPWGKEAVKIQLSEGFYDRSKIRKEVLPVFISKRRNWFGDKAIPHCVWNKVFRRKFLLQHYCREERITLGEDAAFTLECVLYAKTMIVLHRFLYFYNRCNPSMTRTYQPDMLRQYLLLFQYLEQRLKGRIPSVDRQLNDLFLSFVLLAVLQENRAGAGLIHSAIHLRREFKETQILSHIYIYGLPAREKLFYLLLRRGHTFFVLVIVRLLQIITELSKKRLPTCLQKKSPHNS